LEELRRREEEFEHGLIVGRARNHARDLMNMSSSVMTTTALMEAAKAVGERHEMRVTVLDRRAMVKAGFDLTLSIAQGSNPRKNPPYIVILEHLKDPRGPTAKRVVIVGKGVVHDTGGNSMKADCSTMHMDMGGAAEAIAEMDVVGHFDLPINVAMIIFCVRNDVGPDMQITGTPLYSRLLGKVVRNGNTDAEGRLGLAECMAYAAQEWGANNGIYFGIDQATLTGLQRTFFLGMSTAWGTHGDMAWQAHKAGLDVGDHMNVAFLDHACALDLAKAGEHYDTGTTGLRKGPGGLGACGSTVAAEFALQAVMAAGIPWLHIDMAGGSEVSADAGEFSAGGDAPNIITVIRILQDLHGFMERSGLAA
jgi:leucyl aminopeptidase